MFATSRIWAVILVSRVNSANPDISQNFCLAIWIFFQISECRSISGCCCAESENWKRGCCEVHRGWRCSIITENVVKLTQQTGCCYYSKCRTAANDVCKHVMTLCCEGKRRIHSNDELFASHVRAWTSLWSRGRVDVDGDLSMARAAYSSWYYMLSSVPVNYDRQFVGISPCGLAHADSEVSQHFVLIVNYTWILIMLYCRYTSEAGMQSFYYLWDFNSDTSPQKTCLRQSYNNLRIFVQYTLILRQIYDITTIVRTLLT